MHMLPDNVVRYWQETLITNDGNGTMNNIGYALIGRKLFVCQDHDIREVTKTELMNQFGTHLNEFDYVYEKTYI